MIINCAVCANQCECNLDKNTHWFCEDWIMSAGATATTARAISHNNDISIEEALKIIKMCIQCGGIVE